MLRWSRRLAWIAVAVLLLVGVFALLTRDDPRIASDDSLTVYTGFDSSVEPLLNDDLGDEDAEVCDVQGGEAVGLTVGHHPAVEEISVTAAFDLDPGRYSVGYTVCLGDERDSAEVLVTVRETPELRVRAVRPGVYKVVNPGDVTVRFRYGETNDEAPRDGSFKVGPGRSQRFTVQRRDIVWDAQFWDGRTHFSLKGEIHDIELPPGVDPLKSFPGGIT